MKILQDELGLWVNAGGYKSRPVSPTQYKEGDEVNTHHFGGSTKVGVGKDETCGNGKYLEYWRTYGIDSKQNISIAEEQKKLEWYATNIYPFKQSKRSFGYYGVMECPKN
jgi:hypothetical protein